jgi:serine/threonine protein kinase/tetratricopeptide (TPR) repeat protein/Cdc6-like AAA superfamily ATPase
MATDHDGERRERVEALFEAALDLPPGERAGFLHDACRGDDDLFREVSALLAGHAFDGGIVDSPVNALAASILADPAPGEAIGPYRLLHELGRGGMGVVFAARDERLERTVALKFLPAHLYAHEPTKQRFLREARAASTLDHTNICTIHEIGEHRGRFFIAMACYEGETLQAKIARGPLPLEVATAYARQIAAGLAAAHRVGIVHRDVKPPNVMITRDGVAKLLDFGIAKVGGTELTREGTTIGTLAYMSPEQLRGEPVDARSDLWSLGVLFHEMLAGRHPFAAENEQALVFRILTQEPAVLGLELPGLPAWADAAVHRALRKLPQERFGSAGEFIDALAFPLRRFRIPVLRPPTGAPAGPGDTELPLFPRAADEADQPPAPWAHTADEAAVAAVVGREAELRQLEEQLSATDRGARRIVVVAGESGIGKTTLVNAFVARVRERTAVVVGHGQCLDQRGSGEAYMPLLEALAGMCRQPSGRELLAVLDRHAPTWLVQMPGLVSPDELAFLQERIRGSTRERMLREMVDALESYARTRSVLLVLEDLHWSDPSTLFLLDRLARRREAARLMVLATVRPVESIPEDSEIRSLLEDLDVRGLTRTVRLEPLTEQDIADYLSARFTGTAFPVELAGLLRRRTEGNPLFVQSLVEACVARSASAPALAECRAEELDARVASVPDSLRRLIEQQIGRLTGAEQGLLEAASVVGASFTAAAIAPALRLEPDEAEDACEALARRGQFIRPRATEGWPDGTVTGRFDFVHHLHRDVLYERIGERRRIALHRAIGQRLEEGYGAAAAVRSPELASHFLRGHDVHRAVRHLREAAAQALSRSAHREAIGHLRAAIDLVQANPGYPEAERTEVDLQRMLAPAFIAVRGWGSPEAEAAYRRAHDLCDLLGDRALLARILYGEAYIFEIRGRFERSEALLEERLGLRLEDETPGSRVEAHELLSCSLFHQGRFDRSLENARLGLRLFQPDQYDALLASFGENAGVACHYWEGLAQWFLGRPDRAVESVERAIRVASDAGHSYMLATAHVQAAQLFQHRREPHRVTLHAKATRILAEERGFPFQGATALTLRGWARVVEGDTERGLVEMVDGIQEEVAIGAGMQQPYTLGLLAEALGMAGRPRDGLDAVDRALAMIRGMARSYFWESELHRVRGVLLLQEDAGSSEAELALGTALDVARGYPAALLELRAAVELAELWRRRGSDSRAAALVEPLRASMSEGADTPDIRRADELLAAARAQPAG